MRHLADLFALAKRAVDLRLAHAAGWLPALRLRVQPRTGLFFAGDLGRELWRDRRARAHHFAAAGALPSALDVAVHGVRVRAAAGAQRALRASRQGAVSGAGSLLRSACEVGEVAAT